MSTPIKIPVGSEKYAMVDQADVEVVKGYRWVAYREHDGKTYVHTNIVENGKRYRINLASFITGRKSSEIVTFKNNNPLDCRRENLLVVDRKTYLNKFAAPNGRKREDKSSRYTGVRYVKGKSGIRRWEASIRPRGRLIYLGRYISEENAARAYDIAALRHYGSLAKLNLPDQVGEPSPARVSSQPIYREIHCGSCGRPLRVTNPRQKNCRDGGCLRTARNFLDV